MDPIDTNGLNMAKTKTTTTVSKWKCIFHRADNMRRVVLTALTFHTADMARRFWTAGVISGTMAPSGGGTYDAANGSPDTMTAFPDMDAATVERMRGTIDALITPPVPTTTTTKTTRK